LLKWLSNNRKILESIADAETLRNEYYGTQGKRKANDNLSRAVSHIRDALPPEVRIAMGDYKKEKDGGKTVTKEAFVSETIEFFLIHRDNLQIFPSLKGVITARSLGKNTNWQTYRSALDMANDKLEMLANGDGEFMAIGVGENGYGQAEKRKVNSAFVEEKRKARNIKDSVWCDFYVNNVHYVLSKEDVTGLEPWTLKDEKTGEVIVKIHNAIINESVFTSGSSIVNSVIGGAHGKIESVNSYINESVAKSIVADNSIVLQVNDPSEKPLIARGVIVIDVFRNSLAHEDQRFQGNQTRITVKAGYNPKSEEIGDKVKLEGNVFALAKSEEGSPEKGLRDYELNIREDSAIERAQKFVTLIKNKQRDAYTYELDRLEKQGKVTHEFVAMVVDRFYSRDNARFAPDSRTRTELVSFLNLIMEKYGNKAARDVAEDENIGWQNT